jgi:hypothetical protein
MSRKQTKKQAEWKPRTTYAWDSPEAKAIKALHDIVGRTKAFYAIWRRKEDGSVSFSKEMTPQLVKFAEVGERSVWVTLTYQQACSWEEFLDDIFTKEAIRQHMREGSMAPWLWPPSIEGKIYTEADGVPPLTNDDIDALASEGKR